MQTLSRTILLSLLLILSTVVHAGDTVLSNTSGTGVVTWFITGEPSLVLTGFNLDDNGIARPTQVDRVSIDVEAPVANQTATVVVYEDPTGGSPADAALLRQEDVVITQSGRYTHTFTTPVPVSAPVVWVGFYLPVDFEFRADAGGSSVLTYWAWQPGTTFNLADLSSVAVLGPADGSAPVNLDMGGNARITAEFITSGDPTTPMTNSNVPTEVVTDGEDRVVQAFGGTNTDFSPMVQYEEGCLALAYDAADISVRYFNNIKVFCKTYNDSLAPVAPDGYTRRGNVIYDWYLFGRKDGADRLPYAITHCIIPPANTMETGVIGLAYGTPEAWEILPTVRFDDVLCAEFYYTGVVAVFTPN